MLDGYIALLTTLVLMVLSLYGIFAILPSISRKRYEPQGKLSFKVQDVLRNLVNEGNPPVKDTKYLEPYESGEVARGDFGKFVNVQYYIVILLFALFDVDMALLIPWAFNFKALGLLPFIETLIFLSMPMFAVFYAMKEGYMRWLK